MVKPQTSAVLAPLPASLDFQSLLKPPALAAPAWGHCGLCSQGKGFLLFRGFKKAGF